MDLPITDATALLLANNTISIFKYIYLYIFKDRKCSKQYLQKLTNTNNFMSLQR